MNRGQRLHSNSVPKSGLEACAPSRPLQSCGSVGTRGPVPLASHASPHHCHPSVCQPSGPRQPSSHRRAAVSSIPACLHTGAASSRPRWRSIPQCPVSPHARCATHVVPGATLCQAGRPGGGAAGLPGQPDRGTSPLRSGHKARPSSLRVLDLGLAPTQRLPEPCLTRAIKGRPPAPGYVLATPLTRMLLVPES